MIPSRSDAAWGLESSHVVGTRERRLLSMASGQSSFGFLWKQEKERERGGIRAKEGGEGRKKKKGAGEGDGLAMVVSAMRSRARGD